MELKICKCDRCGIRIEYNPKEYFDGCSPLKPCRMGGKNFGSLCEECLADVTVVLDEARSVVATGLAKLFPDIRDEIPSYVKTIISRG